MGLHGALSISGGKLTRAESSLNPASKDVSLDTNAVADDYFVRPRMRTITVAGGTEAGGVDAMAAFARTRAFVLRDFDSAASTTATTSC